MRQHFDDLLSSYVPIPPNASLKTDLDIIILEVKGELEDNVEEKHVIIEANELGPLQYHKIMKINVSQIKRT